MEIEQQDVDNATNQEKEEVKYLQSMQDASATNCSEIAWNVTLKKP